MFKNSAVYRFFGCVLVLAVCTLPQLSVAGTEPTVPARIVSAVVASDTVQLRGNTHPLARSANDKGLVEASTRLERMLLVLQRSPEQQRALDAFDARQYDKNSADYHHWLSPAEFGQLYGPADADIAAVTGWLTAQGFEIYRVNAGKVTIEFSGTAAQVQQAFQVQMHRYLVEGVERVGNDRDPQIPRALAPVVGGIASLNNFPLHQLARLGGEVLRDMKTGKTTPVSPISVTLPRRSALPAPDAARDSALPALAGRSPLPQLGYTGEDGYPHEDVTPYDFATIYNSLPLWNASTPVIGTGASIAIAAGSDVDLSDVAKFRSSFGLPAKTPTVIHNGTDPGYSGEDGDQVENTLDAEMSGAAAPGANVILVVSKGTDTTYGFELSLQYIVSNDTAPIMSMSYGLCELTLGTSGNSFFNNIEQQGATEGISIFVSSGDQGSAGCDSHNLSPDAIGLAVNGMASPPYVTAVGGTDFIWSFINEPLTTYWNSTTAANGASAKGYIPEVPWNSTCANPLLLNLFTNFSSNEDLCNAMEQDSDYQDLVGIAAGSGGVSNCTTPASGATDVTGCSGGYAKPSWQLGAGVPKDGKRDLPDVSLFSSAWFYGGINGSAILLCYSNKSPSTCSYSSDDTVIYQEVSGTSAASPYMAGVMALILQKTGTQKQGLANKALYELAEQDDLGKCNSATVAVGNNCVFYDITSGTNTQACTTGDPDCVTNTSGDQIGLLSGYPARTAYDQAVGLGSVNIANLVNKWSSAAPVTSASLAPANETFNPTMVGATSPSQTVTLYNTGGTAVTVGAISIGGPNASSFVKTSASTCSNGKSLAVGATCSVVLQFKPSSSGTSSAALSVADNSSGSPHATALSGTGTVSGTAASVSPSSLSFGNVVVKTKSAAQTVTVTNTGSNALTISSISNSGGTPSAFPETTTCGSSLASGTSCTVSVQFSPGGTGSRTSTLAIVDGAGTQTVALSGTGVNQTFSVAPSSLAFGNVAVKTKSAPQTVTVSNSGSSAVAISSIANQGGSPTAFPETTTCGSSLAAGASCAVSVTFTPGGTGKRTSTLTITDNAGTQTVALSGTGVTQTVTLNPTSLDFGNQTEKTKSAPQTVTVTNSGSSALTISSVANSGGTPSSFPLTNNCGSNLAAGASCTVSVEFSPGGTGKRTSTLTLTDSTGTQTVALTGVGTSP